MIHTDSYFALGKTHIVCQDYAATHNQDGKVVLAVSDGCSSSPDTDFGSRILVKIGINEVYESDFFSPLSLLDRAFQVQKTLELSPDSLDATLLLASVHEDLLKIQVWGDGVIHVKFKNGTTTTWEVQFDDNAPSYMNYLGNDNRLIKYLEKHGKRTLWSCTNNEPMTQVDVEPVREKFWITLNLSWSEVESAFLFSDGVKSFCRMVNGAWQPVSLQEVLEQVTAVKNYNGEFMVRRMRKFLYDFCPKNNWIHEDDVAVAALINEVK
jgi:hypothetical protein